MIQTGEPQQDVCLFPQHLKIFVEVDKTRQDKFNPHLNICIEVDKTRHARATLKKVYVGVDKTRHTRSTLKGTGRCR